MAGEEPALGRRWDTVGPLRLHVRVAPGPPVPSGPPVVLVHGIVSGRYMVRLARVLGRSCPVYVPDLPGFGRSGSAGDVLDVPRLADVLAGWMRRAALDAPTLVGHSIGSQVVADLAVRHPGRVGRVVLLGPTIDPTARSLAGQYGRWLGCLPHEPVSFNAVIAREVLDSGLVRPIRLFRRFLADRIEDKAPSIAAPTLVARGARDRIAPQPWVDHLAGLLPDGHTAVVSGASHTVQYSHPEPVARLVLSFVRTG